jgi:hypothetical protein
VKHGNVENYVFGSLLVQNRFKISFRNTCRITTETTNYRKYNNERKRWKAEEGGQKM